MTSIDRLSNALPSFDFPEPLAIAFSMESFAKPDFFAEAMRVASRGLLFGSPPWSKMRNQIGISYASLGRAAILPRATLVSSAESMERSLDLFAYAK